MEFMFHIQNKGDGKAGMQPDEHLRFVKQCEVYIEKLKKDNKLIAAQPLIREGCILSRSGNDWDKMNIDTSNDIQVGYYHIRAKDMDEAINIAKDNPEFQFVPSASIRIQPIKTKEEQTNFVYPK